MWQLQELSARFRITLLIIIIVLAVLNSLLDMQTFYLQNILMDSMPDLKHAEYPWICSQVFMTSVYFT